MGSSRQQIHYARSILHVPTRTLSASQRASGRQAGRKGSPLCAVIVWGRLPAEARCTWEHGNCHGAAWLTQAVQAPPSTPPSSASVHLAGCRSSSRSSCQSVLKAPVAVSARCPLCRSAAASSHLSPQQGTWTNCPPGRCSPLREFPFVKPAGHSIPRRDAGRGHGREAGLPSRHRQKHPRHHEDPALLPGKVLTWETIDEQPMPSAQAERRGITLGLTWIYTVGGVQLPPPSVQRLADTTLGKRQVVRALGAGGRTGCWQRAGGASD